MRAKARRDNPESFIETSFRVNMGMQTLEVNCRFEKVSFRIFHGSREHALQSSLLDAHVRGACYLAQFQAILKTAEGCLAADQ